MHSDCTLAIITWFWDEYKLIGDVCIIIICIISFLRGNSDMENFFKRSRK